MDEVTEGARIVMPYDTCRLYQIERVKRPAAPTSKRPGSHPPCHHCLVASRGSPALPGGLFRTRRVACPAPA
jgi:hypothetical protein